MNDLLSTETSSNGLKKILIADDSVSSRALLRFILAHSGFEVIEAADGQEVLEKVEGVTPDAFFLDLNMPRCDGCSAARELRSLPEFSATPIIAVSAAVLPLVHFDKEVFDLLLPKPISPSGVRNCLRRVFANA